MCITQIPLSYIHFRDEKSQLLLGVRRVNRQQTTLPSSVLSTDSMHIGILAAAAHASANRSPFTIFYNPRYLIYISRLIESIFDLTFILKLKKERE